MEKLYHWKKYPTNSFNYVYLMVELENRFKFISKTLKKMQKKTIGKFYGVLICIYNFIHTCIYILIIKFWSFTQYTYVS